jgi:hypothetical protein
MNTEGNHFRLLGECLSRGLAVADVVLCDEVLNDWPPEKLYELLDELGDFNTLVDAHWERLIESPEVLFPPTIEATLKQSNVNIFPGLHTIDAVVNSYLRDWIENMAALETPNNSLPPEWNGRIPQTVRLRETVRPDFIGPITNRECARMVAYSGSVWPCRCNPHGAVAIVFPSGELLGVKPGEFDVIDWKPVVQCA